MAATINEIDLIFQSQFAVVVAVVRLTRFVIFHDYVISISFRAISPTVRLLWLLYYYGDNATEIALIMISAEQGVV